jgi:hypothetical protein
VPAEHEVDLRGLDGQPLVVRFAEVRERDDVVAALVRFEFGGEGAADLDEVGVGQGGRVDGGAAG